MKASFIAGLLLSASVHAADMEMLVPAYFYPSYDPSLSYWDDMTAALGTVRITAIMNPDSGPGGSANSDYSVAVDAFRDAGGKVIGYVHTSYGQRSEADVLAEVASYASFYHIDGIFLDEMSNRADDLAYYQALYATIKADHPDYTVIGNPGTGTLESYAGSADTLVTFEDGSSYASQAPDAWTAGYTAVRFASLLYGVSSAAEMQADIALAASRNVGYVYVTDDVLDNPWDTLPSYWTAEVAAVSAVPEPGMPFLLGGGLLLLAGWQRRRPA